MNAHAQGSRPGWVWPGALFLVTALVYARSLGVPIHETDDFVYFFRDARTEHLSPGNIGRILTEPFFANFHPITTLTIAMDRAIWGTWVPGFHVTQLAFYAAGVLGVYFLFARILASRGAAFAGAAIYSVHTIHVESVAWLASRKDVVCLFFYAFALVTYTQYAAMARGAPRWRAYALCLFLSAAAMLSKGYAVILPAAFLAYDLCFAQRITRERILDKIPFVVLAGATTLVTVYAQDQTSALIQVALPWAERALRLAEVVARYVGHMMIPVRLSAFYMTGIEPVALPLAVLGGALALAIPIAFVFLRRKIPAAAFGIALTALPLLTVLNVFFTLRIWMTDRYLLFPTIGSCLTIVSLARFITEQVAAQGRRREKRQGSGTWLGRRPLAIAAVVVVIIYSGLTIARIGVWTSGVTLWSDVIRKELRLEGSGPITASELARAGDRRLADSGPLVSLARAYATAGNREESARIRAMLGSIGGAGDEQSEMSLAGAELSEGRLDQAARRLTPIAGGRSWLRPQALTWLGVIEDRKGNAEAAQRLYGRAVAAAREMGQPATDVLLDIGTIEYQKGNVRAAVDWYTRAYRESPGEAKTAIHLARALEESGEVEAGLALYKKIAAGDPAILPGSGFTEADLYLRMALAAQKLHRNAEAAADFEEVLRRAPEHPQREAIRAQIAALRARGR